MTLETLTALSDDNLRELMAHADRLLKERDKERKETAMEQARVILQQAGLSLAEMSKAKIRPKPLSAGTRFFNADRPEQIYEVGKGRPPGWFTKGKGRPMAVNDNPKLEAVKQAV